MSGNSTRSNVSLAFQALLVCTLMAWLATALLGCSQQLGWEESRFACDSDAQCASGWRCVQGYCAKGSVEADADLVELEVEQELVDLEVETPEELDELDLDVPDDEADESDELEVSKCTDCYPWQSCDEDSGECVGQCGVGTDCGTISGTFAGQICSATWECADCADDTACTNSAYPPGTQCVNGRCVVSSCTPETNGFPCDDNNPCTAGDSCENGTCAGAPLCWGLTCSAGSCEGSVGLSWSQTASLITSLDVSWDGRFIVLVSRSYFGPQAEYNQDQVFRYDQLLGELQLLSIDSDGNPADFDCKEPSISDDGCVVAFSTKAALLTFDTNGTSDVYVWDCASRSLTVVGHKFDAEQPGNGDSEQPRVSGNGEFVVFASTTSDFVESDPNGSVKDVFRWKRSDESMTLLSRSYDSTEGANGPSENPVVSVDGAVLAFTTYATNLGLEELSSQSRVYRVHHDSVLERLLEGEYEVYSELDLSADGLTLAYRVEADAAFAQIRLRDEEGDHLVSFDDEAQPGDGDSTRPRLSGDGLRLLFNSAAKNLILSDPFDDISVYLWRLDGPLLHVDESFERGNSNEATISGDGRFAFFVRNEKGQHQIFMGALDHDQ
ncbi:MAG: hypothetical protein RBU37_13535 [Myxococcota bacterium]|jgi:hypothetical protein|nr:hypothetical protein [Myxococcota bacterium]